MFQMGEEFARRFKDSGATKILTIEASGIAVALTTGYKMNLPSGVCPQKKIRSYE